MPEPYRSHDWALVPAKPGLQGSILMYESDVYLMTAGLHSLNMLQYITTGCSTVLDICVAFGRIFDAHDREIHKAKCHKIKNAFIAQTLPIARVSIGCVSGSLSPRHGASSGCG